MGSYIRSVRHWPRQTPKAGVGDSNPFWRAKALEIHEFPGLFAAISDKKTPGVRLLFTAPRRGSYYLLLKLRVAPSSGMQLHVADVVHAGEVHDHPLEAQAVAGMAAGAVTPQVAVPPVVLGVHAQLLNAGLQHLQALLTLRAADELADAGYQTVGGGHGFAVVVLTHVEGLDLLGVVGDKHRALVHLLGKETLVLGLQVTAPVDLEVELVVVLFQDLHRLGVAHPGKVGGGHVLQALLEALVYKGVEEVHLVGALSHHIVDDILDHCLGVVHVVGEVRKGHLGLDHPELSGVALGVGLFRPEGGTKGVHVAEGHGEVLAVELAGHGEIGPLAKEVFGVVHGAVLIFGHVLQIQGGHLEHLAGALAVAGSNEGSVDVDEALVLEEAVNGVGGCGAHPEDRRKQIGAGTQVLDGAQELHAVALLLQGVVGGGGALHGDGGGLHLQGLLGAGSEHHGAVYDQGGAYVLAGDLFIIVQHVGIHDDLKILEAGAVVELDKAEGLHIPDGAGPAADGDRLAAQRLLIRKDGGNGGAFHSCSLHFSNVRPKGRNGIIMCHYIAFPLVLQPPAQHSP